MLVELEKAQITTDNIFINLLRDIGEENIPENHHFYELKPAENKVDEYALLSNIIMGSDRFLYLELSKESRIIHDFAQIIVAEKGEIIEKSQSELVAKLLSKNDAIRIAIKLIGIALDYDIIVRAAIGMTGAAAIERCITLTSDIGNVPAVGFTKLGGEYGISFDSNFVRTKGEAPVYQNYLFIDMVDSTGFINKHGRDKLVEIMTGIKDYVEGECKGQIEGYREGGDDFIARFPTKDLALRAGIDSSWFALNNGAKLRGGIGKSRRQAGERAKLAEDIKIIDSLSLTVFELADGLYAYYVPSEFVRSFVNFIRNKKGKIVGIFAFVFIISYILAILGFGVYGLGVIFIAILYALFS